MSAIKARQRSDSAPTEEKEKELPTVDVTSGGYLHISPQDLIESKAAQRQLDAVERLSKRQPEKKS